MPRAPVVEVLLGDRGLGAIVSNFHCAQRCFLARLVVDPCPFFFLDRASVAFVGRREVDLYARRLLSRPMEVLQFPSLYARCLYLLVLCRAINPYQCTFSFATVPASFRFVRVAVLCDATLWFRLPCAEEILCVMRPVVTVFFPIIRVSSGVGFLHVQDPFARRPPSSNAVRTRVWVSNNGIQWDSFTSNRFRFFI